jgi:hypothetical protein
MKSKHIKYIEEQIVFLKNELEKARNKEDGYTKFSEGFIQGELSTYTQVLQFISS